MADTYAHAFNFAQGQTKPLSFRLGPPSGAGTPDRNITTMRPALIHTLRVGFLADTYPPTPERFLCNIGLPDSGARVSGIAVPFLMCIEAPLELEVIPESAPAAARVVVASVALGDCAGDFNAQRSEQATAGGATIQLSPWAIGVIVHNPSSTATWQDSAGAALGVFSPSFVAPRPRLATQVAVTTANSLVTQFFAL